MDELLDIIDTNGNPTGTTALKSKAHRLGLFHATVHIWFYTKNGDVLLQQRAQNKDTYPLLWDVSVAGHVGSGETVALSAIREIKEEIGLTVREANLEKIGVFKSMQKHHDTLIDNEFHHTFLSELKVTLQALEKQENEVTDLKLLSISEFEKELFTSNIQYRNYVPHSSAYYKTVIATIKTKL
ncbi:NUDIX domain-containing protein [Maribacter chungangensis]|uniref:NUDIX domain-containing protein n=1 Tax=Maribacter chungangensis TaxID=1069117 RepID=A0ABW3B512_9FLAO